MAIKTETAIFYPSSIETTSISDSVTNPDNPIGKSSTNSTYAQWTMITGSNAESYVYYSFDCSSIPEDATITSVTCSAKAYASSTSYITSRQMQMYSGSTAKGSAQTGIIGGALAILGLTALDIDCGSWTRAELQNAQIRIYGKRGTSNTSKSASMRFYGSTLTVTYTIKTRSFHVKENSIWKEYVNVYKKINGLWNLQETNSTIIPNNSILSFGGYIRTPILNYHGIIESLDTGRRRLAATTVGNYALFGGGYYYYNDDAVYSSIVDAYNLSLTRSIPTALSVGRYELAATTVGNYALFGGGYYYNNDAVYSSIVDAYNLSLTRSIPTALSVGRSELAATTVGNYALFGGGYYYNNDDAVYPSTVDAYNLSLTRSIPTELSEGRRQLAATTVGNYALFGGGRTTISSDLSTVDAYNSSLTRSIPTALSFDGYQLVATTVGNYALFGGGYDSDIGYKVINAYDTSLTRSIPMPFNTSREGATATTLGNYALFAGGQNDTGLTSYSGSSYVEAYNTSLIKSIPTALSVGRSELAATTVGNYALFGGGTKSFSLTSKEYSATVDVYTYS